MDFRNRNIAPYNTLIDALRKMDALDKKLLIVIDNASFIGLISAGDIQRAIIQNITLETSIVQVLRSNIRVAAPSDSFESIKKMMFDFRMEFCPVINTQGGIDAIYYWEDIYSDKKIHPKNTFDLPVVVMAGGLGTRLKPLTNVLPKPLIPIGEKTMLEEIFDRFSDYGSTRFYLSVNYKADLIEFYIKSLNLPYTVKFFREETPLGTAGSLHLIKDQITETFFVNNCDILIEQDYSEILEYHQVHKNEITIIAALKSYSIPYGTIDAGENGQLLELKEKPEILFKINSGMYLLEPHLLDEIPTSGLFHITQLIEKVKSRKGKIGVFPVSEKSWTDIGDWGEYLKRIE